MKLDTKNLHYRIHLYFVVLITTLLLTLFLNVSNAAQNSNPDSSPLILVLGDSLSAAFGIEQSKGWVSLLEQKMTELHLPFQVINASISGETSEGGLQRLPELLKKYQPKIVILELGANDGLRGLKLSRLQHNLQTMIANTAASKAMLLLVGIRLPPNYGQQYTEQFHQIYVDIAEDHKIPLVPFLLEGIATRQDLMQSDGLHPTAKAQSIVLKNVWEKLEPLLKSYRDGKGS